MGELPRFFLRGADVSTLPRALALKAQYRNAEGVPGNPLAILKENGINFIRLRVWVNPPSGCCNPSELVEFAKRIKEFGFGLLVDFHYSDTWADPEHQTKPAAWASHALGQLAADVSAFTADVCQSLVRSGVSPEMVQIGNEINNGMLWPEGRLTAGEFTGISALLREGCRAAKASLPGAQVMIHFANAGDKAGAQAFYDGIRAEGVEWDVIGLSYYSYWHGPIAAMQETVRHLGLRFGKPVVIVETAYPFTLEGNDSEPNVIHTPDQLAPGYPATPEGQRMNLKDVLAAARSAGAEGVFYWEPTWTAVPGNGWDPARANSGDQWENQALFDFDGRALPALAEFLR